MFDISDDIGSIFKLISVHICFASFTVIFFCSTLNNHQRDSEVPELHSRLFPETMLHHLRVAGSISFGPQSRCSTWCQWARGTVGCLHCTVLRVHIQPQLFSCLRFALQRSTFSLVSHLSTRVLRGLKFCVRSRPAKFKPAPLRTRTLLTRTRPADHPNPRPPRTFSVSNPHLSENF